MPHSSAGLSTASQNGKPTTYAKALASLLTIIKITQAEILEKSPGCPSPGLVRTTSRALSRLSDYVLLRSTGAKEEGRPSRWKDGLARSFMHCGRPNQ